MMDLLGNIAVEGDYFAYALRHGDSPMLSIYQLREILPQDKCRAHKVLGAFGEGDIPCGEIRLDSDKCKQWKENREKKWVWTPEHSGYTAKSDAEVLKERTKTSVLSLFGSRALILKDFDISKYEV